MCETMLIVIGFHNKPYTMNAHVGKFLKWAGIIVGGLVVVIIGALCGVTWWLTPERLTRIVNEQASRRLNADVRTENVRFTLWSTFPHLRLEMDSLHVRSRNLDSLPPALKKDLPSGADFLLSTSRMQGGINLLKLLSGQIWLRDVAVDSLHVNLVAVTDSINNYDIVKDTGRSRIPYFRIEGMDMAGRGDIRYTSLPSKTDAVVGLSGAALTPCGDRDEYGMRLLGKISVSSGGLRLLTGFPFEMDGDVHVRFKPFGISTTDYRIKLGEVEGHLSMDMNLDQDVRIDNLDYRMQNFTLRDLAGFLPPGDYPVLSRIDADLELDMTVRLTMPYSFSSAWLPSAEVLFSVPDGEVSYTLSDKERYTMRHVGLEGRLVFDGRDPSKSRFELPRFHVEGLGARLGLSARVTDLTGNPLVSAEIEGSGDLASVARQVRGLRPYGLSGDVEFSAGVRFRLRDDILYGTLLDLKARSGRLGLTYGPYRVDLRGFRASTAESYADALSEDAVKQDIPLDLTADADGIRVTDLRDAMTLDAAALHIDSHLGRQGAGAVMREIKASFRSDSVNMRAKGARTRLGGVAVSLDARRMNRPVEVPPFVAPASWNADVRTLGFASHTPQYIQVNLPDALRQIMRRWRTRLDVRIGEGDLRTPSYPAENRISGLDMTASFDSVVLRRVAFGSGDTRGEMSARVGNLRQFLTSPVPAPLDIDLDLALDTVQINQLARFYTQGHPGSAIARGDKQAMAEGVDTVAMLVPRNLRARINASAMQTRYINLHLYDLTAGIRVADGKADVDTLRISSDFGALSARLGYDTSDMQDMTIGASVNVEDINVVRFFQNFHRLLEMMPEMKNLSGDISARANGHVRVFPNMYLNVPSTWAEMFVQGRHLKVHQNQFIRHVTKMLLIPDDGVLDIDNIDVHAGVHANLLEVFPFTFEMCDYRLVMGGLNNFNGDMYYHIGVEKWPFRIPFGINIKGHYHQPVLRFGGKHWHDGNGADITSGVMDYNMFNIIHECRRYMGEFVHTAATYEGD